MPQYYYYLPIKEVKQQCKATASKVELRQMPEPAGGSMEQGVDEE